MAPDRGDASRELAAQIPLLPAAAAGRARASQGPVGGRPGPPGGHRGRAGEARATGRVLVRPSGTEPALRVMVEGPDAALVHRAGRRARGARRGASKLATVPTHRSHQAAGHGRGGEREDLSRMCGIVGYIGPREAGPILLEGLARLEYRGYDSAGIALVDDAGDLFVEKRAGKLVEPADGARRAGRPHAAIGLAHTRWATHGRPNDLNAHPHQDCTGDITVIHNGIIENFRELRDGLEARGHPLASETDTEALAHLVEEAYERRPRRGRAGRAAPGRRRLRGRGDASGRGRPARRRPPGRAAHRRARRRRDLPRLRRGGRPRPHRRVIFLEEGDVADLRPWGVDDHRHRRRRRASGRSRSSTGRPRPPRRAATSTSCSRRCTSSPRPSPVASAGRVARDGRIHLEELEPV